jgi:diguanylate cyclase (GGDEF)-like protein
VTTPTPQAADALAELARIWRRYEGDPDGALRAVTETGCQALGVERASVWLLSDDREELECVDLFEASHARHSGGVVLKAGDYPAYFEALEREEPIAADDAHTDPRTSEFSPGYLTPLGIGAMLDAPIRLGLKLVGVVCHEHIGASRQWTRGEQKDAAFLASLTSLALELKQRAHREALLTATLESTGEGILAADATRVIAFNRRLLQMWKLDADVLRSLDDVKAHMTAQTVGMSALVSGANEELAGATGETIDVIELADGRVFERVSRPQVLREAVVGRVWSFRDITAQRRAEDALRASESRMRDLAIRDGLTGLFNRRHVMELLGDGVTRALDDGERLTVALIDIDRFKQINDERGHLIGDAVLRHFARVLGERLRKSDLVGRYGGEEFVVALRGATGDAARRVLDVVLGVLHDRNAGKDTGDDAELPHYTFSAGMAELGTDGGTAAELLAVADDRLYQAKRAGRDRIV